MSYIKTPLQGVGAGLRTCHYQTILEQHPSIPWFEILSDNYFIAGGPGLVHLDAICEHYPVAMHSVGLSIGGTESLDQAYLQQLKQLAQRVKPAVISDHLCWTSHQQTNFHDLLPLPYNNEVLQHVVARIQQVQDYLQCSIALENASSYLQFKQSDIPEWEFLSLVAKQTGCQILLDINNIYVNANNHNFDAYKYIDAISAEHLVQFHLAGHTDFGTHLFDTHGAAVTEPVWQLYRYALERFGPVPTLIEWDNDIPEFPRLLQEVKAAQQIMDEVCAYETC